ncbi:MAG TPA: extensin family protein, partial [Ancylobacter sp.]
PARAPETKTAALPPVEEAEPDEPAPSAAPSPPLVATICPELSNENLAVFAPVEVTATQSACAVDRGVSMSAVRMRDGRLVKLEPAAVLRCEMAASVANWLRNGVDPAIATLGSPLDVVMVAASQQCRPRNRVKGAKISEHGRGNALDTRGYVLEDGRKFVIGRETKDAKAMPQAFQELLKASACADFTTILGPGSDGYHEEHLHVDRAVRRSTVAMCRWIIGRGGGR